MGGCFDGQHEAITMIPFVVYTTARTGSNYLLSLLGSHPASEVKGELFAEAPADMKGALQDVFSSAEEGGKTAAGFKVFYYHPLDGDPDTLFQFLKSYPGMRFIHLKRKNLVKVVLSREVASLSGRWLARGESRNVLRPVDLDPEHLEQMLLHLEQEASRADNRLMETPMLEVYYEELVRDPGLVSGQLLEFLGLPHRNLHADLVRQNPWPACEMLVNWPLHKAYFSNTRLAEYFTWPH